MVKVPMRAVLSLGSMLIRAHALEQPFRTLLTIAGVGLGVLSSVAVTAANVEALRAFERAVLTVAGPATLEVSGHDQGLDETILPAIRNLPDVVEVAPVIEEALVLRDGPHAGESVQVYGLDLLDEARRRGFHIQQESAVNSLDDLLAPDSLYVGRRLSREWNLAPGSPLEVRAGSRIMRMRVAGIVLSQDQTSLWDRVMIMDLAAA